MISSSNPYWRPQSIVANLYGPDIDMAPPQMSMAECELSNPPRLIDETVQWTGTNVAAIRLTHPDRRPSTYRSWRDTRDGECADQWTVIQNVEECRFNHLAHKQVPKLMYFQIPSTYRSFLLDCLETYSSRQFLSSPDDTADGREALTFGEVLEQSFRLAAWLRERGLAMGSQVGIGGTNSTG